MAFSPTMKPIIWETAFFVHVLGRLTTRNFIDGWSGPTPGNVKLRLPPRQSRGNSLCIRRRRCPAADKSRVGQQHEVKGDVTQPVVLPETPVGTGAARRRMGGMLPIPECGPQKNSLWLQWCGHHGPSDNLLLM